MPEPDFRTAHPSALPDPPPVPDTIPPRAAAETASDAAGSDGPTLASGSTLGGYLIERVLGMGGMGAVYLATDPRLGRQVAVKTMRAELAADPAAKERFLREARATARVEHEHVVAVYGVGEEAGTPFLVMPLLRGESLDDRVKRHTWPDLAEACRIGREVALGLAAAHEMGLIHRDVKPSNIWLDGPTGKAKLLDFGLARAAQVSDGLTRTGAVMGTPSYMAPEQAAGRSVDPRADLFSLGCVLYELAAVRRPFRGDDVYAVLTALAIETPPPIRELNSAVPPALDELIVELLTKDPAGRPASARAVADRLAAVERDLAGPAAALTRTTDVPILTLSAAVPPRRRLWAVAAVLAVAVAALLPLGYYFGGGG